MSKLDLNQMVKNIAAQHSGQVLFFKGLVDDFIEEVGDYTDIEFEKADRPLINSLIMDTAGELFGKSGLHIDQYKDFVLANIDMIKSEVYERFMEAQEQDILHKANYELTYHPIHAHAHEVEDELGQIWMPEMIKGMAWHEVPEELQQHLEEYHGEQKVWHEHVESDTPHPLVFGKSADTGQLVVNGLHELTHRLDEAAYRGDQVEGNIADMYDQHCENIIKAEIPPGSVWDDDVVVTQSLAEHLYKSHGYNYASAGNEPHPLEVPMIGPSSYAQELEHYKNEVQNRPDVPKFDPIELARLAFAPDSEIKQDIMKQVEKDLNTMRNLEAGEEAPDQEIDPRLAQAAISKAAEVDDLKKKD